MKVDYRLAGSGWADCDVEIAGQSATMMASYLSHALDELLAGTLAVACGETEAAFSFEEEPQEVRWRLRRVGPERLRVRILRLEDAAHPLPDDRGTLLLDAECPLRTFAEAVLGSARRILAEHGMQGYRMSWGLAEFPLDRMRALEAALHV